MVINCCLIKHYNMPKVSQGILKNHVFEAESVIVAVYMNPHKLSTQQIINNNILLSPSGLFVTKGQSGWKV